MGNGRYLYFAYGSNLWVEQMDNRCPGQNRIAGIGRLPGYTWFINERGYANIAPVTINQSGKSESQGSVSRFDSEVWGVIWELEEKGLASLDINEGAPHIYERRTMNVELWSAFGPIWPGDVTESTPTDLSAHTCPMVVYIDVKRAKGGYPPKEEYVVRMNRGIRDAIGMGIPKGYVERVLRRYIPPLEDLMVDEKTEKLAWKQAKNFQDEPEVATLN